VLLREELPLRAHDRRQDHHRRPRPPANARPAHRPFSPDESAAIDRLVRWAISEQHARRRQRLERQLEEVWRDLGSAAFVRQLLAAAQAHGADAAQLSRFGLIAARLEEAPTPSAMAEALAPLVARGTKLRGGRRPGALDALDRVIVEILKSDPRQHSNDVRMALATRVGRGVIVSVGAGRAGRAPKSNVRNRVSIVVWRNDKGRERRTAWSSIRGRRLGRLRRLVLNKVR